MYACIETRREDVVRQLVKRQEIDPNIRDNEGNTAVIHAVHAGLSWGEREIGLEEKGKLVFCFSAEQYFRTGVFWRFTLAIEKYLENSYLTFIRERIGDSHFGKQRPHSRKTQR